MITTVAGNGTSGYSGDNGPATAAELYYPEGVAVDSAGDLFIADSYGNRIREMDLSTGVITTVAGGGIAGRRRAGHRRRTGRPLGVAMDTAGDLFIADEGDNVVREVNQATGIITTVAGNGLRGYSGDNGQATAAELDEPTSVAVDSAGDLFIADEGNDRIREVNLSTGIITTVAGNGTWGYSGDNGSATAAKLDYPTGVAVNSAGDLFIADDGNSRIREVNLSTGVIATVAAKLNYPEGVAVDSAGDLFIADSGNDRIREVSLSTGVITTVAGNGTWGYSGDNGPATAAELHYPSGIAVDSAGDLFIADNNNERIREVNLSTGVIATVAGDGAYGFNGDNGPATAAGLHCPVGVAVDSAGDVFIADTDNDRIREVASRVAVTVMTLTPTTTLVSSYQSNPAYGQAVTLTATVSPALGDRGSHGFGAIRRGCGQLRLAGGPQRRKGQHGGRDA